MKREGMDRRNHGSQHGRRTRAASDGPRHLELVNVWKRFGEGERQTVAVRNVDLAIRPGEFVTLIGPSGCGKSTLFNMIAGLLPPDADGSILLLGRLQQDGALLGQHRLHAAARPALPWRSVLDNATLALEVEGMPRAAARRKAEALFPGIRAQGLREALSASALRRHAPARGADAHLPVRARPDPARRAFRRARRADPLDDAALAARHLGESTGAPSCSSPTTSTRRSSSATA